MPYRSLIRRVRGLHGRMEFGLRFVPRPDYGRVTPQLENRGPTDIESTLPYWSAWLGHVGYAGPVAWKHDVERGKRAMDNPR
jgi:hypothetical protein